MEISEQDFQSAFNVMHAVLKSEGGNVERGCLFYALAGSWILKEHFGLTVRPVIGSAVYRLDNANDITLAFGRNDNNGHFVADEKNFHAWIFTEKYFVDFMSPVFRETLEYEGMDTKLPRKGYLRPRSDDKLTPDELQADGDFFLNPDPKLSTQIFMKNLENTPIEQLARKCSAWFKKAPNLPAKVHRPASGRALELSKFKLQGMW